MCLKHCSFHQLVRKNPSLGLFLFKTLSDPSTPFNPSSRRQLGSWDVQAVKKTERNSVKNNEFWLRFVTSLRRIGRVEPLTCGFRARMLYHETADN